MSEFSGQCEDQSCSNQSDQIVRVFPCLYHCHKMLCIRHLAEHDRYIEKQIQHQSQLEELWKRYQSMFNEEKIEEEVQKLKIKLDNFRQLRSDIDSLLVIRNFHDSIANNHKLQLAIQMVDKAIEQENQSEPSIRMSCHLDGAKPKEGRQESVEFVRPKVESTSNYASLSSSVTMDNGSETGVSLPSMSNTNVNSPPTGQEDESLQHSDEYDEFDNTMESENEDTTTDESVLRDASNYIQSRRRVAASQVRGYCPLTCEGAFGISTQTHGIRLCPERSLKDQRATLLTQHFRRTHHLTSSASLTLARAIGAGQDSMTTKLFNDRHMILNVDELRTVSCPIKKPFVRHPLLRIENAPCHMAKQVRHLRDHLKRVHKFTSRATCIIIKALKNDRAIDMIEFPQWIDIIEDENDF